MAPTGSTSNSTPSSSGTANSTTPGVNKDMFLQLLVAQLKDQDPLNPTDSSTFVTQLAQFEQLENTINQGQDISAIHTDADAILAQLNGSASASDGSSKTTGTTGS